MAKFMPASMSQHRRATTTQAVRQRIACRTASGSDNCDIMADAIVSPVLLVAENENDHTRVIVNNSEQLDLEVDGENLFNHNETVSDTLHGVLNWFSFGKGEGSGHDNTVPRVRTTATGSETKLKPN